MKYFQYVFWGKRLYDLWNYSTTCTDIIAPSIISHNGLLGDKLSSKISTIGVYVTNYSGFLLPGYDCEYILASVSQRQRRKATAVDGRSCR